MIEWTNPMKPKGEECFTCRFWGWKNGREKERALDLTKLGYGFKETEAMCFRMPQSVCTSSGHWCGEFKPNA